MAGNRPIVLGLQSSSRNELNIEISKDISKMASWYLMHILGEMYQILVDFARNSLFGSWVCCGFTAQTS